MTIWLEIPAKLAAQTDEELVRMKAVCKSHRRLFEHGPAQEREDAERMFGLIVKEQRRRLSEAALQLLSKGTGCLNDG
jgi:hypothetical protein